MCFLHIPLNFPSKKALSDSLIDIALPRFLYALYPTLTKNSRFLEKDFYIMYFFNVLQRKNLQKLYEKHGAFGDNYEQNIVLLIYLMLKQSRLDPTRWLCPGP